MLIKAILTFAYFRYKSVLLEFVLPTTLLLIFFVVILNEYFIFSSTAIFGILLLPFVLNSKSQNSKSIRYLIVVSFFLIVSYFIPLNSLLYLVIISAFILVIEYRFGKVGILSFVYLIIISPIFIYVGNFIGIPARLELTELASLILNAINFKNQVAGNLIITSTSEFSVDPACMGLNMLTISFILAIVIVKHYENQTNNKLNLFFSSLYLLLVLLFNLIGNLIRILILVLFHIPAENSMHDLIGIICLLIYVLLPVWFISQFFYSNFNSKKGIVRQSSTCSKVIIYVTLILTISIGYFNKSKLKEVTLLPETCFIEGYTKTTAAKDVLKFENSNSLIYVKPVNSFYGAEHTPMICWVGSGYSFQQVKKIKLNNQELFVGKLSKGSDTIYCSWWFDNGGHKTINQLEWRWNVIKGAPPYSLININTTDEKLLYSKTIQLLSKNIFHKNTVQL